MWRRCDVIIPGRDSSMPAVLHQDPGSACPETSWTSKYFSKPMLHSVLSNRQQEGKYLLNDGGQESRQAIEGIRPLKVDGRIKEDVRELGNVASRGGSELIGYSRTFLLDFENAMRLRPCLESYPISPKRLERACDVIGGYDNLRDRDDTEAHHRRSARATKGRAEPETTRSAEPSFLRRMQCWGG